MQKIIFGSLLLAGFNASLHAQETVQNLPEILVTATRTETAKNQLAAAATVYTRKDIERLQIQTLPDLLRGTPGIDITQNGGLGKTTHLFMRGTNSDHVLVLIDGIKAGSATSGTTAFELIPIDQIERVEIIRGPQSSLYGSEAIGGVIQLFTRKGGQQDKPSITLDAGGGSYNTAKTSGTISGKLKNSWYSLGASHINTQGFNTRQATEPDKDGYYNTGLNARAGHRFENNAEIEAFFMRTEGKTEYDGDPNKTEFVNQVVGTTASMDIIDNWRSTLRLGQSRDDGDNFAPNGIFSSKFNTTRWNATWLNRFDLSDYHQLVFGSDYRYDEVESSDLDSFNTTFDTYEKRTRYDIGIFSELHSQLLDNHFINASLRGDKNETFGDYVTGNVGWRYNSAWGISPFASFGNAFKAPTFNELYWPDTGFGGGNPDLQPEQSTSFEAGLAGTHDLVQWEVRAYHSDIDNLIAGWPPKNVKKAQIDGVETEISTQLLSWNSKLSMNLLSPRDRETNQRLDSRTDKTLAFDLSKSFGSIDIGGNVLAQGDRSSSFTGRAAGYVTIDLRSAYHLNKNWTLSAKLNNLLDKQYQTINTYNTADRNFFVSIHYNN